jgi:hypothetical protein
MTPQASTLGDDDAVRHAAVRHAAVRHAAVRVVSLRDDAGVRTAAEPRKSLAAKFAGAMRGALRRTFAAVVFVVPAAVYGALLGGGGPAYFALHPEQAGEPTSMSSRLAVLLWAVPGAVFGAVWAALWWLRDCATKDECPTFRDYLWLGD